MSRNKTIRGSKESSSCNPPTLSELWDIMHRAVFLSGCADPFHVSFPVKTAEPGIGNVEIPGMLTLDRGCS